MVLEWQEQVPLRSYATLKTGGAARHFVVVRTLEEVVAGENVGLTNRLPLLTLGGGSNLLVADAGYAGVVMKMELLGRAYETTAEGAVLLKCGAGEEFDAVVADTVARGYWGLENLSAIPGTVGATPVQNVGAYGVEVKDVIESVEVYDQHAREVRVLKNRECHFAYRDSIFKTSVGASFIITAINFRLSTISSPQLRYADLQRHFDNKETPTIGEIRAAVMAIRAEKFPDWRVLGTAGSFFKNPIVPRAEGEVLRARYPDLPLYDVDAERVKVSLGYILDKVCNLKGFRQGSVGLYDKQALVLVNYGDATTSEIKKFVREVQKQVKEKTGLEVELEVRPVE